MPELQQPPIRWVHRPFEQTRDLDNVLALRAAIFNEPGYDERRWRWQYRDNPDGRLFIDLAVDRERQDHLAGHYAVLPFQLHYGGRSVLACQSLDTFTNPEYRNQKVFTDLAEITYRRAAESGALLIYGFPNGNSHPGFIKRLAFRDPIKLWTYHLPLRAGFITRRVPRIPSLPFLDALPVPGFDLLPFRPGDFRAVREPSSDWDEFFERAAGQFPISVTRSAKYYRWRFFDCPDRQYSVFELRRGGRVQGVGATAVLPADDGQPRGVLVDFIAADPASWFLLLTGMLGALRRAGAYSALTLSHLESRAERYLRALGFVRNAKGIPAPVIIRRLADETSGPDVFDPANWFFTPGDTDFY